MRLVVIPESKKSWVWELRTAQDFLVLRGPAGFATRSQAVSQTEALRRAIDIAGIYDLVGSRVDNPENRVAP